MKLRNVYPLPARAKAPERTKTLQCIVRSLTFAVDREQHGLRVRVADASMPEQQEATTKAPDVPVAETEPR